MTSIYAYFFSSPVQFFSFHISPKIFSDCLLAGSGFRWSAKLVWHIPVAVYTVLDSWWWTENLSETCRVLFQK